MTFGKEQQLPHQMWKAIQEEVSEWEEPIRDLVVDLHANPEIAFSEVRASEKVATLLSLAGFAVERNVGGLPTALVAQIGDGPLTVAICIEYDALPDIGHACGHHLIAGSSIATALALRKHVDRLGITLLAVGTPAEEHGGGKILLLERGIFDGVSLAVMMHPVQAGVSLDPTGTSSQAVGRYLATFNGIAAHAAAAPHAGINAGDAAVLSQVAIGLLRQQIPENHRVASFISDGGVVTNIIPERSSVAFECRAFSMGEYTSLVERVKKCFEGAALATGTSVEIVATEPVYEPLVQDRTLASHWTEAMVRMDWDTTGTHGIGGGSTDMGNISQVIPSLHPWVSIPEVNAAIHSKAFGQESNSKQAHQLMFDAARALAWTIACAALDQDEREYFIEKSYTRTRESSLLD
ncbi:amidohydrolase [Paeniglutamicibacter antarcticus]|uniref:Peptidase M20 domain-containing protein 2 n=1 Tax=Paeniglutamicibacter antarcticus TaxID=494023 RepID=A0ABP9TQB5_9MICC